MSTPDPCPIGVRRGASEDLTLTIGRLADALRREKALYKPPQTWEGTTQIYEPGAGGQPAENTG